MDILNSLCDAKKTFTRIRIPAPEVTKSKIEDEMSDEDMDTDDEDIFEKNTTNYAEEYKRIESEKYHNHLQKQSEVMCVETNTYNTSMTMTSGRDLNFCREIFQQFIFDTRMRTEPLAIDMYKDQIMSFIKTNAVVIIEGPTGCGKSTQVPQFILDDCKESRQYCNIVVTQPRRIAAISLARRVCYERGWGIGDVCGYQVGLEKEIKSNTILTYVTTGVLLNKLINKKELLEYTHVIVDEIHERDENMDFLLVLLRKFLYMNYLNVKIILMSATFDTEKFSEYFRNNSRLGFDINAPAVCITHGNKYRVQVFYIEQLKSLGKIPIYNIFEPKIDPCLYENLVLLIIAFDKLDEGSSYYGSVLVFLPGILEIEEAHKHLLNCSLRKAARWRLLPLHSSISTDEQKAVFSAPVPNERKIILSTNIAESSITVNDIVYVVDFCLTKQMVVDPQTQYQGLKLQWASRNNCIQRAGRVGRVSDGRVYRFVPRDFYEHEMRQEAIPEILRCPLDRVVLFAKLLELQEPPQAILALLLDPPNLSNIESTIWKLKETGALLSTSNGIKMVSDGDLTIMGRIMAQLPFDIHLSKLIVLGHIFSCLEDCIIMAAGLSLQNIFALPFQAHLKSYTNKLIWADGSCSDLITFLNLYKVWDQHKRLNNFSSGGEYQWARNNFINVRCLKEWAILVEETKQRLERMSIRETSSILPKTETPLILKVIIAGAFYPNYFITTKSSDQIDEREAVREVGGRDPFTTIYFKNMEPSHPGPLYAKRIKEALSDIASHMQIQFDAGKILVQFIRYTQHETVTINGREFVTSIPGKICMEVYRAVRRRQLQIQTKLPILSANEGWRRVKMFGAHSKENQKSVNDLSMETDGPILPGCDVEYIKIQITYRIDVGHFWAQNYDEQTTTNLCFIQQELNKNILRTINGRVAVGGLYAAKFEEDGFYYRCCVISINHTGRDNITAQILYIDYGDTTTVTLQELREIPEGLAKTKPPQAMECVLCKIKPSLITNPKAVWCKEVNERFKKVTDGVTLYGKVYSVVNGVVHVELYKKLPQLNEMENKSLNDWLIEKGYAELAEESYLSKMNHEKRQQIQNADFTFDNRAIVNLNEEAINLNIPDMQPPRIEECQQIITLRGPYSPLEMKLFSCTNYGLGKPISIDGQSVNAALLDSNPEDHHDRLVVAGHVTQNQESGVLNLKNTTIMPNIPGFPVLMSLLFCPTMQPKLTEDGTFIASILFGLGTYENSNKSVYPAHDMLFTLDTKLDEDDLVNINQLRYWMNISISVMESLYNSQTAPHSPEECQVEIKQSLFRLLKRKRESQEKTSVQQADIWNKYKYKGKILYPQTDQMDKPIWPLHWTMQFNKSQNVEIKNHLIMMQDMATKTVPMTEITCKLCNVTIRNVQDMRIHLNSEIHLNEAKRNN